MRERICILKRTRRMDPRRRHPVRGSVALGLLLALAAFVMTLPVAVDAQEVSIADLTLIESERPLRLMGYGLVVGLDGTGDRVVGGSQGGGFTVRSVANLLRRFEIEVPEELLRTRNVAAVLVTAEASPWLRSGGRFDVRVASLGDATSLRGGVLWMTPLQSDPGAPPLAAAQGPVLVVRDASARAGTRGSVETSAEISQGGVLEMDPSRPAMGPVGRLILRNPDLETAERVARAVNDAFGDGTARVEDPGSVAIANGADGPSLGELRALTVTPDRRPRVLVDSRDGTVVAGGGIRVGEAVVSHEGMTLAIEPATNGNGDQTFPPASEVGGDLRLQEGATVQQVVGALHAVGASPRETAAILRALREVGAIQAEVVVR